MPSYSFAISARREIRGIIAYIKKDNLIAAEKWLSGLHEKCSLLSQSPRIGRVRDDLLPGAHMFPFGNFLIFYDIVENGIVVVHVTDARQDVPNALAAKAGSEATTQ